MSCGCLDRRTFVLAAGAAAVAGCTPMRWSRARLVADGQLALALADLGDEGWTLVEAPGLDAPILVDRDAAGGFHALELTCTHSGCTVRVQRARLVCPCHGSEFARDGAVVQGPATAPLRRFVVTPRDAELVIHLEESAS